MQTEQIVTKHYGGGRVVEIVLVALMREGLDGALISPEQLRRALTAAGFEIVDLVDRTDVCVEWIAGLRENAQSEAPKLGFHLLLGDGFPLMAENMAVNLEERRIAPTQIVCRAIGWERPGSCPMTPS